MSQLIEKSAFDWTRDKDRRIMAKGVAAMSMLSRKVDANGNIVLNGPTRCVWNNLQTKSDSRYLQRRIWVS